MQAVFLTFGRDLKPPLFSDLYQSHACQRCYILWQYCPLVNDFLSKHVCNLVCYIGVNIVLQMPSRSLVFEVANQSSNSLTSRHYIEPVPFLYKQHCFNIGMKKTSSVAFPSFLCLLSRIGLVYCVFHLLMFHTSLMQVFTA